MNFLAQNFCGADDNLQGVCKGIIFFACGFDPLQFPDELLPTIMMHNPAGNSVRQATQYVQVMWNLSYKVSAIIIIVILLTLGDKFRRILPLWLLWWIPQFWALWSGNSTTVEHFQRQCTIVNIFWEKWLALPQERLWACHQSDSEPIWWLHSEIPTVEPPGFFVGCGHRFLSFSQALKEHKCSRENVSGRIIWFKSLIW